MLTRDDVLSRAVDDCMKELYSFAQPSVEWDEFIKENKIYSERYEKWENERNSNPEFKDKSITKCIGPRPYEFYYLPKDILKDIVDDYIKAYKMDSQQELLDTIEILKNYCKEPIVNKYIDDWTDETGLHHPGYRSYDHPDNLEKEIFKIIDNNIPLYQPPMKFVSELQNKFFEFLDMAGNFYNWSRDLNAFYTTIYLGASPNSNKEAVIENWKKYRKQDIEINEEQIKKNYYGEELD